MGRPRARRGSVRIPTLRPVRVGPAAHARKIPLHAHDELLPARTSRARAEKPLIFSGRHAANSRQPRTWGRSSSALCLLTELRQTATHAGKIQLKLAFLLDRHADSRARAEESFPCAGSAGSASQAAARTGRIPRAGSAGRGFRLRPPRPLPPTGKRRARQPAAALARRGSLPPGRFSAPAGAQTADADTRPQKAAETQSGRGMSLLYPLRGKISMKNL